MVGIAIIGCGGIAQKRHIPACLACKDAFLSGFYNRTRDRAVQCAQRYGGAVYEAPEDAFQDPAADAVIICTPTMTHTSLAIAAMMAGKHVLCEKPMAGNAEDARRMLEVSQKTGMVLMPAHNQRRYSAHRDGKEWLQSGKIGRPLSFRTALGTIGPGYSQGTSCWYFQKGDSGRGVVSDIGVHRVDLLRSYFGDIRRVFAHLATLDKRTASGEFVDVDDNAFAILEFHNGVVGSMHTSWTNYGGTDLETIIFGTKGSISMYGPEHDFNLVCQSGERIQRDYQERLTARETLPLTDLCDLFVESIKSGNTPPISAEDGVRAIEAIDAMVRSNMEGRWIDLTDPCNIDMAIGGMA